MDCAAHHLADVYRAADSVVLTAAEQQMLWPNAQRNGAGLHIVLLQVGLLFTGQNHLGAVQRHGIAAVLLGQLRIVEVHLRHPDKPCHKQVGGMVKDLLWRADLLDHTVLHDHDPIAQRHGLGLVVGHIDKRGVDALAQLDDLRTHLVAELRIQIGQRLVHQQDLRLPDSGAANGHPLALAAGERLGLAVQIFRDAQDLRRLIHPLVDLRLIHLAELQGESDVLPHCHMGVQGVILEHHGDIPILGGHIVHQLPADVQLAAGDLLQTGHHPQGGGFAAAGGADQHDEFLVFDLQIKVIDGQNALVGDLQIGLFLRLALLLFLRLLMGIDLLDIL